MKKPTNESKPKPLAVGTFCGLRPGDIYTATTTTGTRYYCYLVCGICFFFKQKTAYEILSGLVGSEMCIRDRVDTKTELRRSSTLGKFNHPSGVQLHRGVVEADHCEIVIDGSGKVLEQGDLLLSLIHI